MLVDCLLAMSMPGEIALAPAALLVWTLLILVLMFGVGSLGLMAIGVYRFFIIEPRERIERLKAERVGYGKEDFRRHFEAQGIRQEVVHHVYQCLHSWSPHPDIPVFPGDSLEDHFGMVVHEEIDDILKECLCREPTPEEWGEAKTLATVEALVSLVDRLYTGEVQTWPAWYQRPLQTRVF